MSKGRKKEAKQGIIPGGLKEPKIASAPPSYMDRKAAWHLSHAHMADPYGWHKLTIKDVLYVQEKLSCFETMTWNEIFVVAEKQNHDIPVAKLRCDRARRWMKNNMPDQPFLWTLRFSGAERVWGIFSEGVYQIVFWDPQHLIYPIRR